MRLRTVGQALAIAVVRAALVLLVALAIGTATASASEFQPTLAELETEVICPTCHTTLDQSSSPVADRMRIFILARIAAGDSKSEIKDTLVREFGDGVLASPPKEGFNLLAWVLPPIGLVAGAAVLAFLAIRWSRRRDDVEASSSAAPEPDVDRQIDDELARLDL